MFPSFMGKSEKDIERCLNVQYKSERMYYHECNIVSRKIIRYHLSLEIDFLDVINFYFGRTFGLQSYFSYAIYAGKKKKKKL